MGWADNQLIATSDCCEVKGGNSMTVRGHRTQPLLMMAIQITHKQEGGTDILSPQPVRQPLMLVNNEKSGHLDQGCDKDCTHKGSVSPTNPKNQHFATTTLKFGLVKCYLTISNL